MTNREIREKLLGLAAEDARVRESLAVTGELFDGYCPRMEAVHLANAAELESIIDRHGWPGRALAGADGAEAAWLIAMHVISRPAFFRRCALLVAEAAARGDAEPRQVAYLEDRIALFEGRPQRYGTQSDWNERGQMQVWTLEDETRVNEYRAAVGLAPLEKLIWETEETRENAPADYAAREREAGAWRAKVGWTRTASEDNG